MDTLLLWAALILSASFNVIADVSGKRWTQKGSKIFLVLAAAAYMIDQLFFSASLTFGALSKNIFIVFLLSSIIDVLIGIFYFKERLSRTNLVGLALGLAALILLNL
jgi:multidrug transporter EmrE-like cation transporter